MRWDGTEWDTISTRVPRKEYTPVYDNDAGGLS